MIKWILDLFSGIKPTPIFEEPEPKNLPLLFSIMGIVVISLILYGLLLRYYITV